MVTDNPAEVLRAFVNDELLADFDEITYDVDSALLGGDLSSLAIMRLVTFTESRFDITIPLLDVTPDNFASVATLADYVMRRSVDAMAS